MHSESNPSAADSRAEAVSPQDEERFEDLVRRVADWRRAKERVVLCHGCFDLLHVGHVRHFLAARAFGDRLVVTITPDAYVDKGPDRPAFPGGDRLLMVESLRMVDAAALNLWPSAVETLARLRPAVFAKGADYRDRADCNPKIAAEEEAVRQAGGVLRYTDEPSHSSTRLLQGLR